MGKVLFDAFAMFAAVLVALFAFAGICFFWARRRFRMIRARLVMRVASGDLSFGSLFAAIRINRHGVATAMVRRRLLVDVDGAVTAVHAAERAGAPIGDLGALAADLEAASRSLDAAMASMGPSGVTPLVLSKARELDGSAVQLRSQAEHLLASAAVPGHDALIESIGSGDRDRRALRSSWRLIIR
jgi:hypothetical protein